MNLVWSNLIRIKEEGRSQVDRKACLVCQAQVMCASMSLTLDGDARSVSPIDKVVTIPS